MKRMSKYIHRYSKGFYRGEDIVAAIEDYRKIATITMSEEPEHYVCSFSNCIVDPKRTVLEFSNYLIELLNTRRARFEE